MIFPIILAGGSGTRLWPLSRGRHPKQFLNISESNESLLQETFKRIPSFCEQPIVVTNFEYRFLVAEQIRQINATYNSILLEPLPKNTAAAITLAALESSRLDDNAIMLVMPADHSISDTIQFSKIIKNAINFSNEEKIVTFGIEPTSPDTGYGYIKTSKTIKNFYTVEEFKEKPTIDLARKYVKSKKYFWNSGIFVFKASIFLNEIKRFHPEIYNICWQTFENRIIENDFTRYRLSDFEKCPSLPIDIAVLEKTEKNIMLPFSVNWTDLGSWESIWKYSNKDDLGNVLKGDIFSSQVSNSLVFSKKLTALIDLKDIVIVDTQDALLVANRKSTNKIKSILHELEKNNRHELSFHKTECRPWGSFSSLSTEKNFQIKLLIIKPKKKISLQKHLYRSEHWVIISGIATVTTGKKVKKFEKNQSVFIPIGEIHRLENQEDCDLKIVEVQTGSYFGEDDIIRIEDDFDRV